MLSFSCNCSGVCIPLVSLNATAELSCLLFLIAHAISVLEIMTNPITITTPATTASTTALTPSTNRTPPSVVGGNSDVVTLLSSGGGCGVGECSWKVDDVATLLMAGIGCGVGDWD